MRAAPFLLATLLLATTFAAPAATMDVDVVGFDLPRARSAAPAVWANGAAYLFGGASARTMGELATPTDEVLRVDPAAMTTSVAVRLPSARYGAAVAWTGESAYVIGGFTGDGATGQVLRFDPATNTLRTMLGTLPPRGFASAVWTGDDVLVFGGLARAGSLGTVALADVWRYDPIADVATPVEAHFDSGLAGSVALWVDGAAFIAGGRDAVGATHREVLRYTPVNETIATVATLPTAVSGASAAWDGARWRIYGGDTGGAPIATASAFDPATFAVTPLPSLAAPRALAGAVWTGSHVSLLGGVSAGSPTRVVERTVMTVTDAAPPGFPRVLNSSAAAWTGSDVVVFGEGVNVLRVRTDGRSSLSSFALSSPRPGAAAFSDGASAFLVGGGSNEIVRFRLAPEALDVVTHLPAPASAAAVVWTGTVAYIADESRLVHRFDPATGALSPAGTLPALGSCCAAAGIVGSRPVFLAPPFTHVFEPFTGTTESRAGVPSALAGSVVLFDGASFYWLGGESTQCGASNATCWTTHRRDALRADIASGVAELGPALARSSSRGSAVWTGRDILVVGGEGELGGRVLLRTLPWPGAPVALLAAGTDGGVALSWSAPTTPYAVNGYKVYVRTGATRSLLADTATRSYTDTSAPRGVERTYEVAAYNDAGEGLAASAVGTRLGTLPSEPQQLTASAPIGGNIELRWAAPASDGQSPLLWYRIYRADLSVGQRLAATVPANTHFYADRDRSPGLWYYTVTAVNAYGEGDPSNTAFAVSTQR